MEGLKNFNDNFEKQTPVSDFQELSEAPHEKRKKMITELKFLKAREVIDAVFEKIDKSELTEAEIMTLPVLIIKRVKKIAEVKNWQDYDDVNFRAIYEELKNIKSIKITLLPDKTSLKGLKR